MSVRMAVVGGNNRGRAFDPFWDEMRDDARLVALCDPDPGVRSSWSTRYPQVRTCSDLADVLAADDVDAVYIASPIDLHARQGAAALRAGKHVLMEVPAAATIEECWDLVEASRSSSGVFMLAENYGYSRSVRTVGRAVAAGEFGELTFGEGSYVHDLRQLMLDQTGTVTWRGARLRDANAAGYPTHALAPMHHWLSQAGRATEFVDLVARGTVSRALRDHAARTFGADHPAAADGYWAQSDSVSCLLRTHDGFLAQLRVDMSSPRPYDTLHATLQGTTGCYESGRHVLEPDIFWCDPDAPASGPEDWRPLDELLARYPEDRGAFTDDQGLSEVILWDRCVLEDFLRAVRREQPPPIDVYSAVNLSAVVPLSQSSLGAGGQPVRFPDFRAGSRHDT